MKVVCVIQARLGSERLPRKVLADIAGKPMLHRVVERTLRMSAVTHVVVAGPFRDMKQVEKSVDALECEVVGYGGDENDVLGRYVAAAQACSADVVVRVTADCPLFDWEVADRVVATLLASANLDYASNVIERTFPKGLDCEAFWFDTLLRLDRKAYMQQDREHVTSLLRTYPDKWNLANVRCSDNHRESHSDLNWSVDTAEDLERVRWIYAACNGEPGTWRQVLKVCEERGI